MNRFSVLSAIARVVGLNQKAHPTNKQSIWLKVALGFLSVGLLPALDNHPTFGAERIIVSYGPFERSISIDALETYAKTGEVTDELSPYSRYADSEQLKELQQLLQTPISLGPVEVSQFLYSPIGERLLTRLGDIIQQESGIRGFFAIRAALILAAAEEPKGLTLLNVLRKFPSDSIRINLGRSLEIANALENLVNETQEAVALINRQSNQQSIITPVLTDIAKKNLAQPGPSNWQQFTITLNDSSRNRTFPVDIYLPSTQRLHPIIVISHGLGSDRESFAYLAEHLASYGFVVAVPEHPGSNAQQLQALLSGTADEVTTPREFIDRPLDIKYLLEQLNRLSRTEPALIGRLNLQQVGVVGQSFGGYTSLALAGAPINFEQLQQDCPAEDSINVSLLLQCLAVNLPKSNYNLSDPQVKAVMAINPVVSSIFGQAGLSQIKIPVMLVASSADTVAPALPEQIRPFTWLTNSNKYLVVINNGTHFSTIAESPNAAVPVPGGVIGPSPALARNYIEALSVAFFQTYIANMPSYSRYLSADYVNAIGQEPLPLSLVQSLDLEGSAFVPIFQIEAQR
jgi:predicted dienelactone hydrolase